MRLFKRDVGTRLRMTDQVPFPSGNGWSYMRITTNITCSARALTNGKYQLQYNIQRNSASPPESSGPRAATTRDFSVQSTVVLRDGQSDEPMVATDPASKHALRVSVTLSVVKHT